MESIDSFPYQQSMVFCLGCWLYGLHFVFIVKNQLTLFCPYQLVHVINTSDFNQIMGGKIDAWNKLFWTFKRNTGLYKTRNFRNPDSAMVYRDIIEPILAAKCWSGHSANQREIGGLRFDGKDWIPSRGNPVARAHTSWYSTVSFCDEYQAEAKQRKPIICHPNGQTRSRIKWNAS